MAARPAQAAVVLTSRYSEVTATAKAYGISTFGESDGPSRSDTKTKTDYGAFSGQTATASSQSAFSTDANGYAYQNSYFTLNGSNLAGASAGGDLTADGVTSSGGLALASSLSDFEFGFKVTGAPTPYTLTGNLTSNQGGGVTVRLYNVLTPGTSIQSYANNATLNASGVLPVGDYRLELWSYISVNTGGIQHATGGYQVDFAVPVPEPTAAGLLGAAGMLPLLRRRRASDETLAV
jgi:hypothetical protein